jgi:hypothetical protein
MASPPGFRVYIRGYHHQLQRPNSRSRNSPSTLCTRDSHVYIWRTVGTAPYPDDGVSYLKVLADTADPPVFPRTTYIMRIDHRVRLQPRRLRDDHAHLLTWRNMCPRNMAGTVDDGTVCVTLTTDLCDLSGVHTPTWGGEIAGHTTFIGDIVTACSGLAV